MDTSRESSAEHVAVEVVTFESSIDARSARMD